MDDPNFDPFSLRGVFEVRPSPKRAIALASKPDFRNIKLDSTKSAFCENKNDFLSNQNLQKKCNHFVPSTQNCFVSSLCQKTPTTTNSKALDDVASLHMEKELVLDVSNATAHEISEHFSKLGGNLNVSFEKEEEDVLLDVDVQDAPLSSGLAWLLSLVGASLVQSSMICIVGFAYFVFILSVHFGLFFNGFSLVIAPFEEVDVIGNSSWFHKFFSPRITPRSVLPRKVVCPFRFDFQWRSSFGTALRSLRTSWGEHFAYLFSWRTFPLKSPQPWTFSLRCLFSWRTFSSTSPLPWTFSLHFLFSWRTFLSKSPLPWIVLLRSWFSLRIWWGPLRNELVNVFTWILFEYLRPSKS